MWRKNRDYLRKNKYELNNRAYYDIIIRNEY